MTTRLRTFAALACSVILLTTACGRVTADPGAPGLPIEPVPADAVALRVSYTGGFVTPAMLATRLPILTVYGDGRVITEGPQITVYPGPALPNVQVQRISPADVQRLIDRALVAGVGTSTDFGEPGIADAPSVRFTVQTGSGSKTTEVYALNEAGPDVSGINKEQAAARKKLRDLLTALTDLPETLGTAAVGPSKAYLPVAVAAVAMPWTEDAQLPGEQPAIAWPGPALPGQPLGELGMGCVTADGAQATAVLDAAKAANTATPWTSGDKRWTVTLRPLLPDESTCADLTAGR